MPACPTPTARFLALLALTPLALVAGCGSSKTTANPPASFEDAGQDASAPPPSCVCTAPANADPTCTYATCGFACHPGFVRSGPACVPGVHDAWATSSSLAHPRKDLAAAAVGGLVYAIGGDDGSGLSAVVEAYTPGTNSWATVASLLTARSFLAAAVAPDGRIYAIGGRAQLGETLAVEAYTPSTNTWAVVPSMSVKRSNLAAAVGVDGRIYAIGGFSTDGGDLATVEAYTPSTHSWATVASMPTARSSLAAVAGADGRIYAIGGQRNQTEIVSVVEAYTPSTDSWTAVKSVPNAHAAFAAAAGVDGRIYVMGGYVTSTDDVGAATVVAYSPSTDAWTSVASMPTPRGSFAAAAGDDSRIYAIGGSPVPTVEAYTP